MTKQTPHGLGAHADLGVTAEEDEAFEALARPVSSAPAEAPAAMTFAEHQLYVSKLPGRGSSKSTPTFKPS
jgi:hypothetical protein